jgi:hypothetical protein
MARTTETDPRDPEVPQRWWFYVALALAVACAMVAARILGMPRGLGVDEEPVETGEPTHETQAPSTPPPGTPQGQR